MLRAPFAPHAAVCGCLTKLHDSTRNRQHFDRPSCRGFSREVACKAGLLAAADLRWNIPRRVRHAKEAADRDLAPPTGPFDAPEHGGSALPGRKGSNGDHNAVVTGKVG